MIQIILIDKDLQDIITKKLSKPIIDITTPKEISDWKKKVDKVTITIILSISILELMYINNIIDLIVLQDKF